jgi:hypothetical protein
MVAPKEQIQMEQKNDEKTMERKNDEKVKAISVLKRGPT